MPLSQSWQALPNITMLGDAAHLMPPFAGAGVNMAMLDALQPSQCLTNESFTDTQQAIRCRPQKQCIHGGHAILASNNQLNVKAVC